MDYPSEQNQYSQYYSSYQQGALTDPSQVHSYDQSSVQAYYDYTNQQYYNSYQQQATNDPSQAQSYDPSSSVQAYYSYPYQYQTQLVAVQSSGTVDPTQYASGNLQGQESVYYPQSYGSVENQSQIGAAQWAMNPQTAQSSYQGKARRGGKPFQRGDRGYANIRGKGRGQNGGRSFPSNVAMSRQPNPVATPSSAISHGPVLLPLPVKRPPRMVWCELCKIDCNTPEILEQHKKGKKHNKKLLTQERLKNQTKTVGEQQSLQMPNSAVKPELCQQEEALVSQELKTLMDGSLPNSIAVGDGIKNEAEKQKDPEENKSAVFSSVNSKEEPNGNSRDGFQGLGRGLKRKMRGGRGGKVIRTNEGSRRPVEPTKPKETTIPYICELCHVICGSQLDFNCHLAGRKHLANVKRFYGDLALHGDKGRQALYPSNSSASSSSVIPQLAQHGVIDPQLLLAQQGTTDPQVLLAQLINYVLLQAQAPGITNSQLPGQDVLPSQTLCPQVSQTNEPVAVSEHGGKDVAKTQDQQQSVEPEFETATDQNTETKTADETLLSEETDANCNDNEVKAIASESKEELVTEQALSASALDQAEPSCSASS